MRDDRPTTQRPATADTSLNDEATAEPTRPGGSTLSDTERATIASSSVATAICPPDDPATQTTELPAVPDEAKVGGQQVRHLWFLAGNLVVVLLLAASISLGFGLGLLEATTTLWLIAFVAGALTIGLLTFHLWSKGKNLKI